jgi:DNA-binding XRE family transcriptional regulator
MQDGDSPTDAELLFLWRRRRGYNQKQAADALGYKRQTYVRLEHGRDPIRGKLRRRLKRELTPADCCVLYRRRADWTQAQVAHQMGVSRLWVNRMERGLESCEKLIFFWEA